MIAIILKTWEEPSMPSWHFIISESIQLGLQEMETGVVREGRLP